MEKQYVTFSDGSVLSLTQYPNGKLEIELNGVIVDRIQVWPEPEPEPESGS